MRKKHEIHRGKKNNNNWGKEKHVSYGALSFSRVLLIKRRKS